MMFLREVVRRPRDYGLDYRHPSLTNVLAFAVRNPCCIRDSQASARRKIERCLESSRSRRSPRRQIELRLRHQLRKVKQDLAWTELDHLLGVDRRYWNAERYARLAKGLCVLAALWRYWRRRFPHAPPYASRSAAFRVAQVWRSKQRGWKALRDHLERSELDWRAAITAQLKQRAQFVGRHQGRTSKRLRRDRDGNTWMVKYSLESVMNPVLASIFTRLSGCPGAEVCPSFLDYDRRARQPCSVQPYIRARELRRLTRISPHELSFVIDGDPRRASQMLCQAVAQWILENRDGHQVVLDEFGNCIWIDHDRSFFIENRHGRVNWQKTWARRANAPASAVSAELIEATARLPGVLEDLEAFIARVEAFPAAAYEGLVRNASFGGKQLCSLFYLDTMGSRALGSVEALEQWIAHLLARKATVRATLARRLNEVLGSVDCRL
jgi:hypothetical protein